MPDLTTLAEYGAIGICISLILLIAFILNRVFKFMGNHLEHNTDAWNKNTEALTKLTGKIDEDIIAQKETAQALREYRRR